MTWHVHHNTMAWYGSHAFIVPSDIGLYKRQRTRNCCGYIYKIHRGTLHGSPNFPKDGYLIDLSASSSDKDEDNKTSTSTSSYNFEFITFSDLLLDCNYRGGGIAIINSLRIGIHNYYVAYFSTNGILVKSGHETLIRDCFLSQHITAGDDPRKGTSMALR
ncbi:hypothetical protein Nepgr_016913 [Nepenthes gracilis]|uniref:Uncharacterized protein n=1 Tax=Nepenthes gracilis TaxID=150966 RepID=A0AAD3XRQ3_NEPGR|nr:hypothetical protein Nepgr_016913 [Nepenthes gracilis]